MRDWVVGGAVIEGGVLTGAPIDAHDGVLLVENVRHNGSSDWTPPGGVIDAGEVLIEGLTREVREETGLEVLRWSGPLYEIRAEAPDLGWRLRVEVHRALEVAGDLRIGEDPDGIVVDADWVGAHACEERLHSSHPWVREPLLEWMVERFEVARVFRYEILGTGLADFRITRL